MLDGHTALGGKVSHSQFCVHRESTASGFPVSIFQKVEEEEEEEDNSVVYTPTKALLPLTISTDPECWVSCFPSTAPLPALLTPVLSAIVAVGIHKCQEVLVAGEVLLSFKVRNPATKTEHPSATPSTPDRTRIVMPLLLTRER